MANPWPDLKVTARSNHPTKKRKGKGKIGFGSSNVLKGVEEEKRRSATISSPEDLIGC